MPVFLTKTKTGWPDKPLTYNFLSVAWVREFPWAKRAQHRIDKV